MDLNEQWKPKKDDVFLDAKKPGFTNEQLAD